MSVLSQSLKYAVGSTVFPEINLQITRSLSLSCASYKPNSSSEKGGKYMQHKTEKTLPRNVEEINASVKAKFSPHRTRDSSSARIEVKVIQPSSAFGRDFMGSQGAKEASKMNMKSRPLDKHVDVYDANNSVSLSSVMQSNVPRPFETKGQEHKTHLNMPGGQWGQGEKYVAGDLHDHHNKNIPKKYQGMTNGARLIVKADKYISRSPFHVNSLGISTFVTSKRGLYLVPHVLSACDHRTYKSFKTLEPHCRFSSCSRSLFLAAANPGLSAWFGRSSGFLWISPKSDVWVRNSSGESPKEEGKLTQRQRLKRAVKEYGVTVIVFHVTISLASLGFFYLLVSSGLDMSGLIDKLGINIANLEKLNEAPVPSVELDALPNIKENGEKVKAVAAGVSTFVLAYAIHKVFAPVRIGITLASTPLIVRHLRKIGVLKTPKV